MEDPVEVKVSFARSPKTPDHVIYAQFEYKNKKYFLTYDERKPKRIVCTSTDFPFADTLEYTQKENIELQDKAIIESLMKEEKDLFWCHLLSDKLQALLADENSHTEETATLRGSDDALRSDGSPVRKLTQSVDEEEAKINLRHTSFDIPKRLHTRQHSKSQPTLPLRRPTKINETGSVIPSADDSFGFVPDSPRAGSKSLVAVEEQKHKSSSAVQITRELTPKEKIIIHTREELIKLGFDKKDNKGKLKLDCIHTENLEEIIPLEVWYMASEVIDDGVRDVYHKKGYVVPCIKIEKNEDIFTVRHEYSQPRSFFNATVTMKWKCTVVEEGKHKGKNQYALLEVQISGEERDARLVEHCLMEPLYPPERQYKTTHIHFDIASINQRNENASSLELQAKQNAMVIKLDELMKGYTNSTGIKNMRKKRSEGGASSETLEYYKKTAEERTEEEQDKRSKSHVIGAGRSQWADQYYHALAETDMNSSTSLDALDKKIERIKQTKMAENKVEPLVPSQIACLARP